MSEGKLEDLLVSAKGLENSDFLHNVDPYVLLTWRTQEQKSNIAFGQGTEPEWNETFVSTISGRVTELSLKIMDTDNFSSDDYLGEAKIDLEPLFVEGSLPATTYNVVKDGEYHGEIRVSLTFTPEVVLPPNVPLNHYLIVNRGSIGIQPGMSAGGGELRRME